MENSTPVAPRCGQTPPTFFVLPFAATAYAVFAAKPGPPGAAVTPHPASGSAENGRRGPGRRAVCGGAPPVLAQEVFHHLGRRTVSSAPHRAAWLARGLIAQKCFCASTPCHP